MGRRQQCRVRDLVKKVWPELYASAVPGKLPLILCSIVTVKCDDIPLGSITSFSSYLRSVCSNLLPTHNRFGSVGATTALLFNVDELSIGLYDDAFDPGSKVIESHARLLG